MAFILLIILSIVVWHKGYRWYALIPLGADMFISGIVRNANYFADTSSYDYLALIAIVIMLVKKPTPAEPPAKKK